MLHAQYVSAPWVPTFVDYLSLGFWTATAFSPTDISAIKPWAKLLMAATTLPRRNMRAVPPQRRAG